MDLCNSAKSFPAVVEQLKPEDVEQTFSLVEGLDALRKKDAVDKMTLEELLNMLGDEMSVEDIDAFFDAGVDRVKDLKETWQAADEAIEKQRKEIIESGKAVGRKKKRA